MRAGRYLSGELKLDGAQGSVHRSRDAEVESVRGGVGVGGGAVEHDTTQRFGCELAVGRVAGVGQAHGHVADSAGSSDGDLGNRDVLEVIGYVYRYRLGVEMIDAGIVEVVEGGRWRIRGRREQSAGCEHRGVAHAGGRLGEEVKATVEGTQQEQCSFHSQVCLIRKRLVKKERGIRGAQSGGEVPEFRRDFGKKMP